MRRALLATVALLAFASPSSAQEAAHGAPAFGGAPVLAAGEYRDTIRPGETLFYAVDVAEGEAVSIRALVRGRDRLSPLETRLRLYNTQRVEDAFAHDAGYLRSPGTLRLRAVSGRVGPPNPDYPEPGTHYFSLSVVAPRGRVAAELGVTLAILKKEVPPPEPLPVKADAPVERIPEPPRLGTYLVAMLGGVVAGGLGAFVVAKVRQPPPGLRHRL